MDQLRRERWRLLSNVVRSLEPVMTVLGLVWLLLLILEFTRGATPTISTVSSIIWVLFGIDFVAELLIAPSRKLYLRRHWIVLLSLALPALRFLRLVRVAAIVRAARAVRGVRLLRTLTSLNRALASLRTTMSRRGFGYVMAMTMIVTLGGAAAMLAFEHDVADPAGIHDFGTALWWTAMIMTTMGSAYWPQTVEGRILCVLLALYAFAVFGYVTATLASFFLNRDAERSDAPIAGATAVEEVRRDVAALREQVAELSRR
ncbi:MAG TPA: potassium channel family protein [Vicinamibacterales bacterium]|nr:potassium channel family protein [Vicinamibacterales bacterium]